MRVSETGGLTACAQIPFVRMAQGARALPEPGATVCGKYEVVRLLGEGGMGVVYVAKHTRLSQLVALKFLHPKLLDDEAAVVRFEREARNASGLNSPYAAHIYDVDQSNGVPFMVCEYLEGTELLQEIKKRGALPIQEAVDYVLQASIAIADAHALGIVHRDLKPSNLFLAKQGKGRVCKVLDFGISKGSSAKELDLTTTGMLLGSPRYMSPEQVDGGRQVDTRTDIWSLAVILFYALSAAFPFEGENVTQIAFAIAIKPARSICALRPDIPKELEAVIMTALQKSLSARYPNVKELIRALVPFGSARFTSALFGAGGHLSSYPPPQYTTSPGVNPTPGTARAPSAASLGGTGEPALETRRVGPDDPTMELAPERTTGATRGAWSGDSGAPRTRVRLVRRLAIGAGVVGVIGLAAVVIGRALAPGGASSTATASSSAAVADTTTTKASVPTPIAASETDASAPGASRALPAPFASTARTPSKPSATPSAVAPAATTTPPRTTTPVPTTPPIPAKNPTYL